MDLLVPRARLVRRAAVAFLAAVLALSFLATAAAAATGFIGAHSRSTIWCLYSGNPGSPGTINVKAPTFSAYNATPGAEDYQAVTWRSVLFMYNGSTWVSIVANNWIQSYWTFDGEGGRQIIDFTEQNFAINTGGYYRVAIQYYAWKSGTSPGAGTDYVWANPHKQYSTTTGIFYVANYCKMFGST